MKILIWTVLFKDGTSKIFRTECISNIIEYTGIDEEQITSITRIGYASVIPEKEEWIWC